MALDDMRRDGTLSPEDWEAAHGGGGALLEEDGAPEQAPRASLPLQMAAALLRWRRLLAAATLGAGLLVLPLAFLLPHKYVGTVTFIAENQARTQMSSDLVGVAAQFGLRFPAAGRERSPEFYVELIRSDRVLRDLLRTPFAARAASADSLPLIELLKVRGNTETLRLERGVRRLRRLINPSIDLRTGIIRLEVEMQSAGLAAAVANWLIREADNFNRTVRQTQRRDHRRYVEARLGLAQEELAETEDALRVFLDQNRRFADSPTKRFEEGQLIRQVDFAKEVYLTLRRELETARIEEQNDVPVLTVVDPALPPERPAFPRPLRMLVFGMIVGLVAASSVVFLVEYVRVLGSRDPRGRSEIIEQLRGAQGEVRRITRLRRHVHR